MTTDSEISKFISKLRENEALRDCVVLFNNKEYDKALKCFNSVLNDFPDNSDANLGKAIVLNEINEWGLAIQQIDLVLENDPNNVDGLKIKAEMYSVHGNVELALKCYNQLINIEPLDEMIWLKKAEILEEIGNADDAKSSYEEILKINPTNRQAKEKLGIKDSECPDCGSFFEEGNECPICGAYVESEKIEFKIGMSDKPPDAEEEIIDKELDAIAAEVVEETLVEEELVYEQTDEDVEEERIDELVDNIVKETEETVYPPGVVIDETSHVEERFTNYDSSAGREWMSVKDLKKSRGSAVNLFGLFCIMSIAIYLMYITAIQIYDNLTVQMDMEIFLPNVVIFILGFGALYGGITAAKNSIIFDHFLNSTFENEIYKRLEPALEEIAGTHARLDGIEERIDRLSMNIYRYKRHPPASEFPSVAIEGKISMFLKFIVIINMTIGIFIYSLIFPGRYAPYVFTMMYILWWLVITEEYRLWKNPVAWAWVILAVFGVPVVSILLYVVVNIGVLIGLIGIFLAVYAYTYFAWARYHVEGVLPFGMHEGELQDEMSGDENQE